MEADLKRLVDLDQAVIALRALADGPTEELGSYGAQVHLASLGFMAIKAKDPEFFF